MAITGAGWLVNFSAEDVRLFFRIYFIVLGTTIGPIGKLCSAARAKLLLAAGKDVNITSLMGWLYGTDCFTVTWKLRALPSGALLTVCMILVYFVNIGSDLVSTLIRTEQIADLYIFDTGLVLAQGEGLAIVPSNGYPYTVVSQAQVDSVKNRGLQGIYKKVNQDGNFSATAMDVLGGWTCTQNPVELSYPRDESVLNIGHDLLNHQMLYSSETANVTESLVTGGPEHIAFLDSSNDGVNGKTWDAKVVLSTEASEDAWIDMLAFTCTLQDNAGWLSNVLRMVSTTETLPHWLPTIQGAAYYGTGTPIRPDIGTLLEKILNTFVMISAGGNNLLNKSQKGTTYGCLVNRTRILWEVLGLAAIALLLNGALVSYLVVLKVGLRRTKHKHNKTAISQAQADSQVEMGNIPADLLGWMMQASQESRHTTQDHEEKYRYPKPRDIKRRSFGWISGKRRFGIRPETVSVEEAMVPLVHNPKWLASEFQT